MEVAKRRYKRAGDHSFYADDSGQYAVIVANATSYAAVRADFSAVDMYLPQGAFVPEVQTAFLMLQAYRYVLAYRGHFQMHSAVVMKHGAGIAFCGLSGAGKSTQAHLWEEHLDAEPLNLDQPCILLGEGVEVSGSPWSGKEDCYKTDVVPLRAIFFVEQAGENAAERLSPAEAFSHLFLNNFLVPPEKDMWGIEKKHQAAILRVATEVPVFRLKCTISREAVDAAYRAAFGNE